MVQTNETHFYAQYTPVFEDKLKEESDTFFMAKTMKINLRIS